MAVVLVVDDEFGIAELIQAILEDEGHRVLTAIHGRAALERLAQDVPELVLIDYMMPVMDGAALFRAIAQDPKFQHIRLAMMSSLPRETVLKDLGDVPFLRKPFRYKDVLAVVDRALEGAK